MPAPATPASINVLGVRIDVLNQTLAREFLFDTVRRNRRGYVAITNVHSVSEAQKNPALKAVFNQAMLSTPDGMPMVWLGKVHGYREIGRVYGPDLMLNLCEHSVGEGFTHFFYGGKPGVADDLKRTLENQFPGLQVVGTYCPPFRALNDSERADLRAVVDELRPDFFWVGLGAPKQERFIADYLPLLPGTKVLLGVGAAFDLLSGHLAQAPLWVRSNGLEWIYRWIREPRRLTSRYILNNPLFIIRSLLQLTGLKKYPLIGQAAGNAR